MAPITKTPWHIEGLLLAEVERTRLAYVHDATDENRNQFEQALRCFKDFVFEGRIPLVEGAGAEIAFKVEQPAALALSAGA